MDSILTFCRRKVIWHILGSIHNQLFSCILTSKYTPHFIKSVLTIVKLFIKFLAQKTNSPALLSSALTCNPEHVQSFRYTRFAIKRGKEAFTIQIKGKFAWGIMWECRKTSQRIYYFGKARTYLQTGPSRATPWSRKDDWRYVLWRKWYN